MVVISILDKNKREIGFSNKSSKFVFENMIRKIDYGVFTYDMENPFNYFRFLSDVRSYLSLSEKRLFGHLILSSNCKILHKNCYEFPLMNKFQDTAWDLHLELFLGIQPVKYVFIFSIENFTTIDYNWHEVLLQQYFFKLISKEVVCSNCDKCARLKRKLTGNYGNL